MLRLSTLTRTVNRLLVAASLVVCLAPLRAQNAAARAVILDGDVSFLKDGSSGYKWALNQGGDVKPGWIVKTGKDGYAKFQVSDGSTFEVFPNSEITFRQDPGNWTHLLNVWIGHIKVMIQHLPGVANPNNVTSPTAVISVRGTIFDVVVEDVDGTTLVSLDEGLVQVHHRMQPGPDKFLNPGEAVRVFPNMPLAQAAVGRGNIAMKLARVVEQGIYEMLQQRRIGGGSPGSGGGVGSSGGTQADRGKNGGTGSSPTPGGGAPAPPGGAPTPPGGAPTPPGGAPPPPPPGGSGGGL